MEGKIKKHYGLYITKDCKSSPKNFHGISEDTECYDIWCEEDEENSWFVKNLADGKLYLKNKDEIQEIDKSNPEYIKKLSQLSDPSLGLEVPLKVGFILGTLSSV